MQPTVDSPIFQHAWIDVLEWQTFNEKGVVLSPDDKKLEDGIHMDQNGDTYYIVDNEVHREDGPAIIDEAGFAWYWKGKRCKSMEHWAETAGVLDTELYVMLKLRYT